MPHRGSARSRTSPWCERRRRGGSGWRGRRRSIARALRIERTQGRLSRSGVRAPLRAHVRSAVEPAVNAPRLDTSYRGRLPNGRSGLEFGKGSQPLTSVFVTFAGGSLAQLRRTFGQTVDPQVPGAPADARLGDGRRQDSAQTLCHIGVDVVMATQQALEPRRSKDADCRGQPLRQVCDQPVEHQQVAVVRAEREREPVLPLKSSSRAIRLKSSSRCWASLLVQIMSSSTSATAIMTAHSTPPTPGGPALRHSCPRPAAIAYQPHGHQHVGLAGGRTRHRTSGKRADRPASWYSVPEAGSGAGMSGILPSTQLGAVDRHRPTKHPEQPQIRSLVFGQALRADADTPTSPVAWFLARPAPREVVPALIIACDRPAQERHGSQPGRLELRSVRRSWRALPPTDNAATSGSAAVSTLKPCRLNMSGDCRSAQLTWTSHDTSASSAAGST